MSLLSGPFILMRFLGKLGQAENVLFVKATFLSEVAGMSVHHCAAALLHAVLNSSNDTISRLTVFCIAVHTSNFARCNDPVSACGGHLL